MTHFMICFLFGLSFNYDHLAVGGFGEFGCDGEHSAGGVSGALFERGAARGIRNVSYRSFLQRAFNASLSRRCRTSAAPALTNDPWNRTTSLRTAPAV